MILIDRKKKGGAHFTHYEVCPLRRNGGGAFNSFVAVRNVEGFPKIDLHPET